MANQMKGLGKGLGALLGDNVLSADERSSLLLPISQVESCSTQPRKAFDPDALADLSESIRQHGIIQPLTVRKLQSGYYQIIAGERRWRAARMAGLTEVPAIVIEADDRKAMELAMIENLQREDLNPIEEAEGYQVLMSQYSMTQEETAQRVGKSRSAVANALRLLNLCPPVRAMVEDGRLTNGHARALNQRESCDYTVTAYYQPLNTPTASKRPATVRSLGNGKYVVEAVNYNDYLYVYAHSWNLVVKVEKVSHSAEEVTVSKYLELNDKTMMLVTVKGTPEGGSAFTYDGNTMYKVEGYGTDRYAWLVIVDKGQTLTQEEAAAKVAISAADNVVTITPSFDVNRTGKVDVNDAQLVYDMYNGTYSDFTKVSVEKFLRADVNATKAVDHADAVAIVNQFK